MSSTVAYLGHVSQDVNIIEGVTVLSLESRFLSLEVVRGVLEVC
jgi:hypothetical protein